MLPCPVSSLLRFLGLAVFLVAVAAALWWADLPLPAVIFVMALALLITWTIEWLSWRREQGSPADELHHRPAPLETAEAPSTPAGAAREAESGRSASGEDAAAGPREEGAREPEPVEQAASATAEEHPVVADAAQTPGKRKETSRTPGDEDVKPKAPRPAS